MEVSQIKKICLKGSKTYLDFLSSKPNGGVEEIDVAKIDKISKNTYKLKVSKKLFAIDSVSFRYKGSSWKDFTSEDVQVKVYDIQKRTLVIKVSEKAEGFISDLNAKSWKLIIDLKFLVQRVIDWYELNGNKISFNTKRHTQSNFDSSVIFQDSKPSSEQQSAIDMIFNNPLSYVWGAPGTGKTRYVLSYSILSYIKQKKKVLVLAPTNVALEQVLSGVLEMTDKAGLSRKKVLRLGYPSQTFANEYGEICEIQGLEKELKRVNNQITILSSILGIQGKKEVELKRQIKLLEDVVYHQNDLRDKEQLFEKIGQKMLRKIKEKDKHVFEINRINREVFALKEKKKSFVNKLFGLFSKKNDIDGQILQLIEERSQHENKLEAVRQRMLSSEVKIDELKAKIASVKEIVDGKISELKKSNISSEVRRQNAQSILKALRQELKKEQENNEVYQSLSKEYDNLSKAQLEATLRAFHKEKERLLAYSVESRIEDALLVGATIDTFIHRFKEERPKFAHVFIDEAGYASIVKALTVFVSDAPVTFLGDHKQLPPVCEISRSKIEKDDKLQEVFTWDQSAIFTADFKEAKNLKAALNIYFNEQTPSERHLPTASLTESFRFGPNLARVLDQYVYDKGFSSKKTANTEIILYNVTNPPSSRGRKRLNEAEAIAIQNLIAEKFKIEDSVAILTPYRAQVTELKNCYRASKTKIKY